MFNKGQTPFEKVLFWLIVGFSVAVLVWNYIILPLIGSGI